MKQQIVNIGLYLIFVVFVFASIGCCETFGTCDECKDVTCQNGGTCFGGTCSCSSTATGSFTGTYCETFVPYGSGGNPANPSARGCTNPNSFNYNPAAVEDDGSCREMFGCVGYTGGYGNSGYLTNTFGSAYWDKKMTEEIAIQSNFFSGISASVFVLVEPSVEAKNAYASPNGQILFGYYMFYHTIQNYGELPVAGVLAHEWGHRVQQTLGWQNYTRVMQQELEADAFSGFYMALQKQYAWANIQGYYQNVYATGDYNFNHPSHHGTGEQRLKSAYLGVNTALDAMKTGKKYTYQELHTHFINEIHANIGQKGTETYPEVVYPAGLTKAYLQSLFPSR